MAIRIPAALLLALAGCVHPPVDGAFESRRLATIPDGANVIVPPAFSADGRSACYVARAGGVDRIMRSGRPGPAWELI